MTEKMTIRQWLNKNYKKQSGNKEAMIAACMTELGVSKTSFQNKLAVFVKNVTKTVKKKV